MATHQKISYCLWFNQEAEEAANFYAGVFKNVKISNIARSPADTPSGKAGTVLTVSFNIEGQQFMGLNGGPQFKPNPSISFFVHCKTASEVTRLWKKLSDGGIIRMPLDKYFFSKKYGWIEDKFGISWQLILAEDEIKQIIVPCLIFVKNVYGKASEALHFYTSVFKNSKIGNISPYGKGMEPEKENSIAYSEFQLEHQWFSLMESAREHTFQFNEGISFVVNCDTQKEIDSYWKKLSAVPQAEMCGWLKDKYGVSWQIVPSALPKLIMNKDPKKSKRVMEALMKMKKLDIAELENA